MKHTIVAIVASAVLSVGLLGCPSEDAKKPDEKPAAAAAAKAPAGDSIAVDVSAIAEEASKAAGSITAENAEAALDALEKELAADNE